MSDIEDQNEEAESRKLPTRLQDFINRLYRDPRYLLIGKIERFGRELAAFIEGCTIIASTGDVRGQALINSEFELRGRPDGQRPYHEESLVDYYHSTMGKTHLPLGDDEFSGLREESWQYYVRRCFAFLLGDYQQAREDAEHNHAIWNLVEQSSITEEYRWSYLRWWPWIERDRAIAQTLLHLEQGRREEAAAELYLAQRAITQYGERHAEQYAQEDDEAKSLCAHMTQHISSLVEILREEMDLPVSMEERLDDANARGDHEEAERLRGEMIRRAVGE